MLVLPCVHSLCADRHSAMHRDTAAIASRRAGELYGLEVLDSDIQDNAGNVTRFLVLARDPLVTVANDPRPHKTSVVFAFAEGPGQLVKALSMFALRDLAIYKVRCTRRPLCVCLSVCLASILARVFPTPAELAQNTRSVISNQVAVLGMHVRMWSCNIGCRALTSACSCREFNVAFDLSRVPQVSRYSAV